MSFKGSNIYIYLLQVASILKHLALTEEREQIVMGNPSLVANVSFSQKV